MNHRLLALFAASAISVASASAAPLAVVSYSTLNGATGSFDYRDFTYLPCPASNCTTTAAPLSGGTGKLTDGVSPTLDWYQQGNFTSWMGWDRSQGELDPIVTFFFGQTENITSMTVWESNSLSGGVAQPGSIVIGGVTKTLAPDSVNTAPHALSFTGLNFTGSSIAVEFDQAAAFPWVIIGEVSFNGTPAVAPSITPEPGTAGLVTIGALALSAARRRFMRA